MAAAQVDRRYLTNFDSTRTGHILTDVLVIGGGVAGASAAIAAAAHASVVLLTKDGFADSATSVAQGGIADAIGPGDSADSHFEDTLRVGCGLGNPEAVRRLVDQGPGCIDELIGWGLAFDRDGETLSLGREGGHRFNRIVHAAGDQTGRQLAATLQDRVRQTPRLRVFEQCFLIDLLTLDGTCVGAVAFHNTHGHQLIWAKQTILAGGGCGRIWRETTNPAGATGDGLAAAYRAGATLCDMEMMQFHPTTLYVAGAGRALISEAVRGEGAYLVDREGHRFMEAYHPDAELAPRDIVSRAIHQHIRQTQANCVYLDVRHMAGFARRFPHIAGRCGDFEIDITRDLIPVRPSAHYMIGGVLVDLDGASSVPGLLCCGEAASSGVHGANRLASNSLLEGLVFGKRAGETAGRRARSTPKPPTARPIESANPPSQRTGLDLSDITNSLKSLMWRNAGVERRGERLRETCDIIGFWSHYTLDKTFDERDGWVAQNQLTVARLIAASALERDDSIGVHHRTDAPDVLATIYHVHVTPSAEGPHVARVPG